MATKHDRPPAKWVEHPSGVTPRIRELVEKAGGQRAFIRRVFVGENPKAHQGKVFRWYTGKTSPRPAEGKRIARAFDVPYEWLLTGRSQDSPEISGPVDEPKLRASVRDFVIRSLMDRAGGQVDWNEFSDDEIEDLFDGGLFLEDGISHILSEVGRVAGIRRTERQSSRAAWNQLTGKVPDGALPLLRPGTQTARIPQRKAGVTDTLWDFRFEHRKN